MMVYNIAKNVWTTGPSMTTPRECALAVCDQVLYAIGGYDERQSIATVEGYSLLQNRWFHVPDLPSPVSGEHVATDGHYLRTFGDYTSLTNLFVFDVRRGQWNVIAPPPDYVPNRHSAVVAAPDGIYVIGGNASPTNPGFDAIQRFPRLSSP